MKQKNKKNSTSTENSKEFKNILKSIDNILKANDKSEVDDKENKVEEFDMKAKWEINDSNQENEPFKLEDNNEFILADSDKENIHNTDELLISDTEIGQKKDDNTADKVKPEEVYEIFKQANESIKDVSELFKQNIATRSFYQEKEKKFNQEKLDFEQNKEDAYNKINIYKEETSNQLAIEKEKLEKDHMIFQEEQNKIYELKDKLDIKQIDLEQREKNLNNELMKLKQEQNKYHNDKQELTNNLVKFNTLVANFYEGVDKFK